MADRDAAFREALDEVMRLSGKAAGVTVSDTTAAHLLIVQQLLAAHARVLALYAEAQQQGERDQLALAEQVAEATMRMEQGRAERQEWERLTAGEELEVTCHGYHHQTRVPFLTVSGVRAEQFQTGQRVRVTRVEEETS